jgi:hypothetical protein
VNEQQSEPVFPVGFDDIALEEDLSHLPVTAEVALRSFDRLGGCVKTYIPWPDGRFGAVFVAVTHPSPPLALRVIAFGVRHHPHRSSAESVDEVADRGSTDSPCPEDR